MIIAVSALEETCTGIWSFLEEAGGYGTDRPGQHRALGLGLVSAAPFALPWAQRTCLPLTFTSPPPSFKCVNWPLGRRCSCWTL